MRALPAVLLFLMGCESLPTWSEGYNAGCEGVEEVAFQFGLENGVMCNTGEPGLICAANGDGDYGEGWELGCEECFQAAYQAGYAEASNECTP